VDVVVGEEISTLNGHLIGLYLSEQVPPGLSARETIRLIHDQGGLAVAAHPFHPLRGVARGHRPIGPMIPDLALDGIEVVNNAGVFSRLYDAWAAGRDASALRGALEAGRTRARVEWSWTAAKMPRHVHIQSRSAIRFLQGGHRGHS
jgi:predicted metal-dependent phosphoesterase TrpH